MSPNLTADNTADSTLAFPVFSCNIPLARCSIGDASSNIHDIRFGQSGIPMSFASCDQFRVKSPRAFVATADMFRLGWSSFCASSSLDHFSLVILSGSKVKMGEAHATSIIASVKNKQPIGDWSIGQLPCDAMGVTDLTINSQSPIPIRKTTSSPDGAWSYLWTMERDRSALIDFGGESIFDGDGGRSFRAAFRAVAPRLSLTRL